MSAPDAVRGSAQGERGRARRGRKGVRAGSVRRSPRARGDRGHSAVASSFRRAGGASSWRPKRSWRRRSGAGAHQARRPSRDIVAGTSSMRTTVASIRTARLRPRPIWRMGENPPVMNAPNTTASSSAAQLTTRPERRSPVTTEGGGGRGRGVSGRCPLRVESVGGAQPGRRASPQAPPRAGARCRWVGPGHGLRERCGVRGPCARPCSGRAPFRRWAHRPAVPPHPWERRIGACVPPGVSPPPCDPYGRSPPGPPCDLWARIPSGPPCDTLGRSPPGFRQRAAVASHAAPGAPGRGEEPGAAASSPVWRGFPSASPRAVRAVGARPFARSHGRCPRPPAGPLRRGSGASPLVSVSPSLGLRRARPRGPGAAHRGPGGVPPGGSVTSPRPAHAVEGHARPARARRARPWAIPARRAPGAYAVNGDVASARRPAPRWNEEMPP